MNVPSTSKRLVLSLYRDLLRYGAQLQYTDRDYFAARIRREFRQSASLTDPKEIEFSYKMLRRILPRLVRFPSPANHHVAGRSFSKAIDSSRVPVLQDEELEESFVRGSGPGGQAVAKTNNKVVLTHKPTGIVVQCHTTRSLFENRREARKILIAKLDQLYNGEQSVAAQQQRIEQKKQTESARRKQKLQAKKKAWKEREFGSGPEHE
uniref:Uncharacterized protein n=2 Tax=Anopheles atroparvus TaxID=41427 RepID=A0A182IVG9_ANOAO